MRDLPQGEEKRKAVQAMFDTIAPRYDLVNRVMTFRMDVAWRRRTVTDLGLAFYPDSLYLICSLAGEEPHIRAWTLAGGQATEVPLRVGA